jgi:hypothetical protein
MLASLLQLPPLHIAALIAALSPFQACRVQTCATQFVQANATVDSAGRRLRVRVVSTPFERCADGPLRSLVLGEARPIVVAALRTRFGRDITLTAIVLRSATSPYRSQRDRSAALNDPAFDRRLTVLIPCAPAPLCAHELHGSSHLGEPCDS